MVDANIDELDQRILGLLYKDARQSNREIARALDIAEGTVRLRLKRLLDNNIIETGAVTHVETASSSMIVYLWITVDTKHPIQNVLRALVEQSAITYVTSLIGRADILAIVWVNDATQLTEYLHTSIDLIPGISKVEYELVHRHIKHDYTFTHILSQNTQKVD